jgi:hypothetical protein
VNHIFGKYGTINCNFREHKCFKKKKLQYSVLKLANEGVSHVNVLTAGQMALSENVQYSYI